jgi:hypothetical protein
VSSNLCTQNPELIYFPELSSEVKVNGGLVIMGTHVHCNTAMSAFSALHLLRSYNHLLGPTGKDISKVTMEHLHLGRISNSRVLHRIPAAFYLLGTVSYRMK